jgi:hypothetical protein
MIHQTKLIPRVILFNSRGGGTPSCAARMGKSACPCKECATLAEPRVLCKRSRTYHRQRYGVSQDDEALAREPARPVDEESSALQDDIVPVPEESQTINEEAFARDVVLLVVNSGLTWKAAEDMVKVFNAHCRGKVVTKNLPATPYQLKRITSCVRGAAKLYPACPKCDFVFNDGQGVCIPCGLPPMLRVKRQLLVNDVGARIQRMFANPMLARAFGYAATRVPGDGDVWDGAIMRDIPTGKHGARTHKHNAHIHITVFPGMKSHLN